jgi:photosystem II stability/assembly factor-like uncharacterized protein
MSDLDPLASRLRQDVARVGWPEATEIRSRARRRRLAHRMVGTSALVVAILAGSSVGLTLADHRGTTPDHSPPSNTAPASSAGPTAGASRPFALDVSFADQQRGWLLAAQPCPAGECPVLLNTTDGGRSWVRLPALPAGVGVWASGVRFADAGTGYLYSADLLYVTRDGGKTWQQQPGYADAVEVANGTALRVSPDSAGCQPACSYSISRAPAGDDRWQTVLPAGSLVTGAVQLRRGGHRAFVGLLRNPAGGVDAHGVLLTSTSDGATWTRRADPCGSRDGHEAVLTELAAAVDGSLTVQCYIRGGTGQTFLITSTDAGAHFGPPHATPVIPLAIGAASASTLFVAQIGAHQLYRSVDGGAHWSVVATGPDVVVGDIRADEIAFSGPDIGRWLSGDTIYTTGDAGRTWTPYRLPSS